MRYSKEVRAFIEENVKGRTGVELTNLVNEKFGLNLTESQIKSYKTNHHLTSGTPHGKHKGYPTKKFPAEVKKFIQENYKGTGHQNMANLLNSKFNANYTMSQIKGYYCNHGLNSGITGRFEKGHISPNRGIKGIYPPGSEKGWFKPGDTPKNHRPVGSERIASDGYLYIKTAEPKTWELKHHLIWQEHYGEIPEGNMLIFLDGNKLNLDIKNLALVSSQEHLMLNRSGLRTECKELTESGILVAKLKIATKERIKKTAP
ncbi:MAG: HNH endonuclease signature motif containing protein [Oscillospiraceae bacterium]